MKSEGWETYKIKDLSHKIGIGPFGSSIKVETFVDSGVPIISGRNLKNIRLSDEEFNYITNEHAERLKNAIVYRGDVIFTHAGNISAVSFIPKDSKHERYILSQRNFYLRCNRTKLLPEYITYFFKTREGQHKLLANSSSVGVPSIAQPVSYLKNIEVTIPAIQEQERIVQILSTLDDKIELNLQMNKTLEAIAQANFKEMFTGETYTTLSQYVEINPSNSIKKGSVVRYIEMSDLPTTGFSISSLITRPFTSGSKFQNHDTLLARITPCLENGKSGFVDFLHEGETAFGSTEFIVMRPKKGVSPYLVYLISRDANFRLFAIKSMVGTSGRQRVQTDVLKTYTLPLIDEAKIQEFSQIVKPLFNRIKLNTDNSRTLVSLRDLLLSKLMTGKIRVAYT